MLFHNMIIGNINMNFRGKCVEAGPSDGGESLPLSPARKSGLPPPLRLWGSSPPKTPASRHCEAYGRGNPHSQMPVCTWIATLRSQ